MVMRITGISSGMDIESMVKKLMEVERLPIEGLKAKKTKNEWTQDAYRAINTSVNILKEQASQIQYNGNWPKPTGANGEYTQADKDAIAAKVSKFVTTYNETSYTVKSKVEETVDRAFKPLTSEEKSAMSEADVKTWEAKAKTGLLYRDDILSSAYNGLRTDMSTPVNLPNGTKISLSDIGVSTGAYDKSNPAAAGKLIINSDKLNAAIAADPQAVIDLFSAQGTGASRGIGQRVYESTGNTVTAIVKKAGGTGLSYTNVTTALGKADSDIDRKISKLNDSLTRKENHYYTMFTAMEKAIANGNAQMSWLSSQFG